MSANNGESQGGKERASWSKDTLYEFFYICNAQMQRSKGKKGAITSQRVPWKAVESQFRKKTNLHYDKVKLKSKLDWMKSRWSLWKQLKGTETGLGWDHEKGTISASDEWWNQKIQENPKFGAFRDEGIEQDLEYKMDQLFGVSVASGANKHNPFETNSSGIDELDVTPYVPSPPHSLNINNLPPYNEHEDVGDNGSGAWEEFWTESNSSPIRSPVPIPSPMLNSVNESGGSLGKRPMEYDISENNKSAKINYSSAKKRGTATLILENIEFLRQSIVERNEKKVNESSDGVGDALTKVFNLPGLKPGTDLFSFACSLMSDSTNRIILSRMPDNDAAIAWIKFLFSERKNQ
ncbi:uncharacterized protein LOC141620737 [Silene latifolia]|uniref:uncharacterized protein LOC141620737 n=1 Tax=Silene latifolia TaxID=37657 RepID=UPI003D772D02